MRSNQFSFLRFVCTALTVIMALAWLFPLYWIISTSLTAETATIALPPTFIPVPPDLEAFIYVIQNSPIFRWYFNTILVSLVITFVSILVSLMCAYALSILEFKGKGLDQRLAPFRLHDSLWRDGHTALHVDEPTALG